MKDWFTVESIDGQTFAVSEYGHWEEPHCYLLCGAERSLLIDTGLGVGNLGQIVSSLTKLPVTVVTTHVHWDHIGGHRYFDDIAVHEKERLWISGCFPLSLQAVKKQLTRESCDFPSDFSIDGYEIYQGNPQRLLRDGDIFDLGQRQVTVIHTPGHSPGHCCFYESKTGYLFSGDLVYEGCLDAYYPSTDPQLFWTSVRKVREFEVRRIFPGHHRLFCSADLLRRVDNTFSSLYENGMLRQGAGVFYFEDFQLHI